MKILIALLFICGIGLCQKIDTIKILRKYTTADTFCSFIPKCITQEYFKDTTYYIKVWGFLSSKYIPVPIRLVRERDSCFDLRVIDSIIYYNTYKYVDSIYTIPAKKAFTGFYTRQAEWVDTADNLLDTAFLSRVSGLVLRVFWRDIQPNENGPLNVSYITSYINFATKIKQRYNIDIKFKLRIVPGIYAPQWAKDKAGIFDITKGDWEEMEENDCIIWWNNKFVTMWTNLQTKLAAIYDTNQYINGVVMSATTVETGEALIRKVSNQSKTEFLQSGYTSAKDLNAVYGCMNAMKAWKQTNIEMSITPWVVINKNELVHEVIDTTINIQDSLCRMFGTRAVVGNNGLRTPDGHNGDDWDIGGKMYNLCMSYINVKNKYKANIFFQTAAVDRQGTNIEQTIEKGIIYKATAIELPGTQKKIQDTLTLSELSTYKLAILANTF